MRRLSLIIGIAMSVLALPAAAQHLVGTAFNGSSFVQLVDVVPTTGVATFIAGTATTATSISGQTAYDATGNRYFYLATPTAGVLSLYVVNIASASFTVGAISGVAASDVQDIEYDPSGDVLYALVNVAGAKQLATVEKTGPIPAMGTVTLLGTPFSGGAVISYSGFNKLDGTANHDFFTNGTGVLGVNTALASPDVYGTGPAVGFISGIQVDSDSSGLYALQLSGSDLRVLQLSTTAGPGFGAITTTGANLTGGTLSSNGPQTFDSAGNLYYFVGTPTPGSKSLYAVNTASPTLTLAAGFPLVLSGVTSVTNLEFDPGTVPVTLQTFCVD